MLNSNIFKEYDLRGVADSDLADDNVMQLTEALVIYFQEHGCKEVLIGRDCRLSSPRIREAMVCEFLRLGLPVIDIGQVTTPMFYSTRVQLNIDAGVMITASHNPPPDNGMKVALGPATIYGDEIQKIRLIAEEVSLGQVAATTTLQSAPATVLHVDVADTYLGDLLARISLGPRKLKVVIDCGNGTAGPITERFLRALGVDYIPLFMQPDGSFPNHEADPTKTKNLTELRATVLREHADLGVGFDGDGDRIGIVDDQGNVIWGDYLMILYWREILAKHPGERCLIEVKCSQALVDEIIKLGGRPEWCKTGHSLIKARMREIDAKFAGEMSGHMFFADEYYGFDDALYACGRLLRILSNTDKSLSELLADAPKYYSTAETRIPCPDERKVQVVEELKRQLSKEYEVIDVDGVRALFEDGWGLFRCSNTQPVIVARCEAKDPVSLENKKQLLGNLLTSLGLPPFEWAE